MWELVTISEQNKEDEMGEECSMYGSDENAY